MARRGSKTSLALVFIAITCACSSAQPICQPTVVSLQSCIAYMASNATTPPAQCCNQLASLVRTQALCLCTFINAVPQLPFNVNRTQAIALPGACNIQAPPLSQCNVPAGTLPPGAQSPAAGPPQGAPGPGSPSDTGAADAPRGPSTPSTTGVPASKGGSKAGPNNPQSSSAISSAMSGPSLFFSLWAASMLATF